MIANLTAEAIPPRIWRGPEDVPPSMRASVVTVGVFDGMHRGHARLVDTAVRHARERGLPAVLITFDPHPAQVLGLPKDTSRLSSLTHRAELARQRGIDAVYVLSFTSERARQSSEDFVDDVLVGTLHAKAVVVGANFTFGHRGTGTVRTLHDLGQRGGFTTHAVPLLADLGAATSSTRVRRCLRNGDDGGAAVALGRPHRIEGRLVPLEMYDGAFIPVPDSALPAPGRYTAQVVGGGCVELTVTVDGSMLVQSPLVAGPATIELDGKDYRVGSTRTFIF
ncbi:cytidyltransferase [Actinomycetospora rhizophila]|uniref:FAD synthase n=1 Tax=Actinomycetospora rhizophila TaxID=1416876 RepID=A0ABV9ZDF6_9PSEU